MRQILLLSNMTEIAYSTHELSKTRYNDNAHVRKLSQKPRTKIKVKT